MTNGLTTAANDGNFERRLVAIEAVLATLTTRPDLAELHAQFEQLRTEMRLQNQQIRSEMQVQSERAHGEMYRMVIGVYRWTIVTTLVISVAIGMFVFGLGNLFTPQVSPSPARTSSTSIGTNCRVAFSPQPPATA